MIDNRNDPWYNTCIKNKENDMKTYLFDFDGTLVDSMPTYGSMMLRILDENNVPYPEDILKIVTPLGFLYTARYYIEHLNLQKSEEELVAKMNEYAIDAYTHRVPAKEHVIEVVHTLKERGCDLNVLTASPHLTLDPCLKRLGLYDLFDNVWSCNDFKTTKADPEIYRMAAEKIGVPVSRVVFLDDNLNADKTAKEAGMCVIGVYDDSSREYVDEMKAVCDGYVYRLSELLD